MPNERPPESTATDEPDPTSAFVGGTRHPGTSRSRLWGIVALGLLASGVVGAVLGADMIAERQSERAHVQFERSSSDVAPSESDPRV